MSIVRNICLSSIITLSSTLLITSPLQAMDIETGYRVVNNISGLNVRYGPDTGYRKIASLDPGDAGIEILSTKGKGRNTWARIRWDGKIGWVSKRYLRAYTAYDKDSEYVVSASPYLNVRQGPGTNYRKLTRLSDGTGGIRITRLSKKGDSYWARIAWNGKIGWVHSKFLEEGYASYETSTLKRGTGRNQYTVRSGDTLFAIMRQTGKYWRDIAQHNQMEYPYMLEAGQVIELP